MYIATSGSLTCGNTHTNSRKTLCFHLTTSAHSNSSGTDNSFARVELIPANKLLRTLWKNGFPRRLCFEFLGFGDSPQFRIERHSGMGVSLLCRKSTKVMSSLGIAGVILFVYFLKYFLFTLDPQCQFVFQFHSLVKLWLAKSFHFT